MNNRIPKPVARVARFEKLAHGMFVHWGLYSQLGQGEWIQHLKPVPQREYDKLKATFTAADFDARALARLARAAGMRYITLTTRHHEGFSLYDTRGLSDFDAPHSPAGRDLVAEFVDGCRAEGIVPFLYHTTLDWRWNSHRCNARAFAKYLDYLHTSVEVLCRHYGPIGGLWFDKWGLGHGRDGWSAALVPLGVLCASGVVSVAATMVLRRTPPAGAAGFTWGLAVRHLIDTREVWRDAPLRVSALGVAFFWGFGGFVNLVVIQVARMLHGGGRGTGSTISALMACACFGIAAGSVVAGLKCRRHLAWGLVPPDTWARTTTTTGRISSGPPLASTGPG